ncbi:hypothetical protein ACIOWG_00210 [Streptomyces sp. NPDC087658]|uniref:hypothetical protein n=1 Tax=Streptomyces sp. NPDC087658 TaxID=3365800 RepID=UPI00381A59AC
MDDLTPGTPYRVVARRVPNGWELHFECRPPVYIKRLDDAFPEARIALSHALELDADSLSVQIRHDLASDDLSSQIRDAVQATADAARAQTAAATEMRKAVVALKNLELTGRDIAHVLGLSPQRVSQLLKS